MSIENTTPILSTLIPDSMRCRFRTRHYTDRHALKGIVATGEIRPFPLHDAEEFEMLEDKPMAWFSSNEICEPVSRAGAQLSGHMRCYLGDLIEPDYELDLARIEVVSAALHEWSSYMVSQGIDGHYTAMLARNDITWGSNPNDWWVSGAPIDSRLWISIEVWDGESWIPLGESMDTRDIEIARGLPVHLTQRTPISGQGNDLLDYIRNEGGYDRISFAESEVEYAEYIEDSDFGTPVEILTDMKYMDPVFRVLKAIETLSCEEAERIIDLCGNEALELVRANSNFARFVAKRIAALRPFIIRPRANARRINKDTNYERGTTIWTSKRI